MVLFRGITAAILAGGLGMRLRQVVSGHPKVLAEVNGRPFITYLLDQLGDAGIERVVICTGYKGEMISGTLGDEYHGMQLLYSHEPSPLGTGGGVRLALPLLDSDPLLVMNGDSCFDTGLAHFIERHRGRGGIASLLLVEVADVSRYGVVDVAPDDAVVLFEEKGERQGPGLINSGVYLLGRSVIESIAAGEAVSLERDVFPGVIGKGLYGFRQTGRFIDIGTPADYYAAADFFSEPVAKETL